MTDLALCDRPDQLVTDRVPKLSRRKPPVMRMVTPVIVVIVLRLL